MEHAEAEARLLDAAERLFYERGVHAVGMAEIRQASGVALKRVYRCFASKDDLVAAYLRRRDQRWRTALVEFAESRETPRQRLLAVFDWLGEWFDEPGFRGCAFVNSVGELGAVSGEVVDIAREHKKAVRSHLAALAEELSIGADAEVIDQLQLLLDGAITTAAITQDGSAARRARRAAEVLLTTYSETGDR